MRVYATLSVLHGGTSFWWPQNKEATRVCCIRQDNSDKILNQIFFALNSVKIEGTKKNVSRPSPREKDHGSGLMEM